MAGKKRLLSGVQSSGKLHIGNYLGAIRQFVDLYQEYDSMFMLADYHALTSLRRPEQLRANTLELAKDYVACGLNPKEAIIFKQSDVLEHTELAWIFNCLVSVPFLMQAHAYKDKVAKGLEANAGLFTYPMLMAADILLYDTEVVPVGQDQRQHVEYAREAANKFNTAFGPSFVLPEERILEDVAVVPGTDGRKMSKSYGNTIPLFGTPEDIRTAVMNIKTDSTPVGAPLDHAKDIVFALHTFFSAGMLEDLRTRYEAGSIGYKESKELLAENITKTLAPLQEKRASLSDDDIISMLQEGGERARERAAAKMKDVRQKIGVTL